MNRILEKRQKQILLHRGKFIHDKGVIGEPLRGNVRFPCLTPLSNWKDQILKKFKKIKTK